MIEMLVSKKNVGRASKNQSDSLEQELTNIVLNKIALKALNGDAKRYFQKGHDLERTYTEQLTLHSNCGQFSFGKIEQVTEVELVKKLDKKYVKDSVDRLIFYLPKDSTEETSLLCEMKVSVVLQIAQQERERVLQFHNGKNIVKHIQTHHYRGNTLTNQVKDYRSFTIVILTNKQGYYTKKEIPSRYYPESSLT